MCVHSGASESFALFFAAIEIAAYQIEGSVLGSASRVMTSRRLCARTGNWQFLIEIASVQSAGMSGQCPVALSAPPHVDVNCSSGTGLPIGAYDNFSAHGANCVKGIPDCFCQVGNAAA
jgi:hypothetical protein